MNQEKEIQVPKEVIVVEGRGDTTRLIEIFGNTVKTIETNGSAIDQVILEQIENAHNKVGVIVLTDPDYPGERIRRIIEQAIPKVKHAYIQQFEAQSSKANQSLGIEHASKESIIHALKTVMTPADESVELIPTSELMALQLIGSKRAGTRRDYIANYYKLGHINGKQLQKRLAMYCITLEELKETLEEGEKNGAI
ncbi:ribonuclease M5 [Aerococcaceae bacterium WGS1372]